MDTHTIILGAFLDAVALPFCYEGSTALMAKQWPKAFVAYAIGIPLGLVGLSVAGVLWPTLGSSIATEMSPLAATPWSWLAILLFLLLWIGGPGLIERARYASVNALRLANEDAEIMGERVQFYTHLGVSGEPKLTGTAPFIEFAQPMINASVFSIEFEPEVEGRIYIDDEEQKDRLEFIHAQEPMLHVERGAYHCLILRQWLSPEVARKMQENVETAFDFGHAAVNFVFEHRRQKRTVRKALGNQLKWTNQERAVAEMLASARTRKTTSGVGKKPANLRFEDRPPLAPPNFRSTDHLFANESMQITNRLKEELSKQSIPALQCAVVIGFHEESVSLVNDLVAAFNSGGCKVVEVHRLDPGWDDNAPASTPLPPGVTVHWTDSPYGRGIAAALLDAKLNVHKPDNVLPAYAAKYVDVRPVVVEIGQGSPWRIK